MADAPAAPAGSNGGSSTGARQRLQVFLARAGVASRRASERLIASGRVAVNGEPVTVQGLTVAPDDRVTLDGRVVTVERRDRYFALHKPAGYLCSNADQRGRHLARELLPADAGRLFHVGRLDLASSGLILFTSDGQFAVRVTHPRYQVEKEYEVTTDLPVPASVLEQYRAGCRIDGITYTLAGYRRTGIQRVALTLTEGRNREIRRVLGHAGIEIRRLVRVRIGPLTLDAMPSATWRHLSEHEVAWFLARRPCPRPQPAGEATG
jgi:23S rRNA pseudouridine2605 synthase